MCRQAGRQEGGQTGMQAGRQEGRWDNIHVFYIRNAVDVDTDTHRHTPLAYPSACASTDNPMTPTCD